MRSLDQYVTLNDLEETLQVSRTTVHTLRQRDDFPAPAFFVGRSPRFRRADIEAFLERLELQPA